MVRRKVVVPNKVTSAIAARKLLNVKKGTMSRKALVPQARSTPLQTRWRDISTSPSLHTISPAIQTPGPTLVASSLDESTPRAMQPNMKEKKLSLVRRKLHGSNATDDSPYKLKRRGASFHMTATPSKPERDASLDKSASAYKKKADKRLDKSMPGKARRFRPGLRALKEIRALQKSTNFLIPRLPFMRLIKQTMQELYPRHEFRITAQALDALQEMTEHYFVTYFDDALVCALHARRVTLLVRDMQLVRRLRGRMDLLNP